MAWPNPFRRSDENTRTCWGYSFQLTPGHLTVEEAAPLKQSYDRLGAAALERLDGISSSVAAAEARTTSRHDADGIAVPPSSSSGASSTTTTSPDQKAPTPKRDVFALLRTHHASDPILTDLWQQANTVPDWVDWAQIARGQDIFYRYGGPMLTGLAFQSLLGGMGAARVVEVLARTGGFATSMARRRLFETAQHILQCTRSEEGLRPGGEGWEASIRVRLLHAAVRRRILALAEAREGYFDVVAWGVPINDLDCIATIGTFSATLVWLALPRQGIWMRRSEVDDYIAMWRYIAYLTGTPTEFFETAERAQTVMESLLMFEVRPSETSKVLANNVLNSLEGSAPSYPSRAFLEATSRWLNGNELCDALGLGRPSLYYWALMTGQCLFFMGICYTYRAIPFLDRRKIAALKKAFWMITVEGKTGLQGETSFDFKHIPNLHKTTVREESEKSGARQVGVEGRNLRAFAVGSCLTVLTGYLVFRVLRNSMSSLSSWILAGISG